MDLQYVSLLFCFVFQISVYNVISVELAGNWQSDDVDLYKTCCENEIYDESLENY